MVTFYTEKYTPRLKYVVQHVFEKILCTNVNITKEIEDTRNADGPVICYSRTEIMMGAFNILPHGLLFQSDIRELNITVSDWDGMPIFFQSNSDRYDLPFDIFSAIFYLISRYEEYNGDTDNHGRFLKENSLAYKNGFITRPLVDEWAYRFEALLTEKIGYTPAKKQRFRMHSSVVIDDLFKYRHRSVLRNIAKLSKKLFSGDWRGFRHQLRVLLYLDKDPYNNLDYIIKFHNDVRLNPSFFVLMHKGGKDSKCTYSTYGSLRKTLRRSYVTGLHPSYASDSNTKKIRKELKSLEKYITKQRVTTAMFHRLRFNLPKSYESLLKIGIQDDYSMGYIDAVGFRASTCTPFRFYDMKHECKTRLMVHPLLFTDESIKESGIHHNSFEDAMIPMINSIKKVNGQFCCCVSNRVLSNTDKWYGWRSAIERVYRYASELELHDIQETQELMR
ncbi:MAG: hypothetical protein MJ010_05205 [Paludibacteraceae bacterium]|nr:hypothetical protein [Paludibacteraceae bacterium]